MSARSLVCSSFVLVRLVWCRGARVQSPHSHIPLTGPPKIGNDILDFIGNTPLVRLNAIPKSEGIECEMLAKVRRDSARKKREKARRCALECALATTPHDDPKRVTEIEPRTLPAW